MRVFRRGFWVALGLGAGAAGAVIASKWTRKQAARVAPATLVREAKGGLLDFGKLVSESIAEGRQAMEERERELRGQIPTPHPDDPPAV
ncbi:MAG: hypothetical protein ACXWYT_07290 [Actinomycetota bacterium]